MALAYGVVTGLGPVAGMYGAIAVGYVTVRWNLLLSDSS